MSESVQIAGDRMVSVNYTLSDEDGNVLDSSERGGETLNYIHGHGQIIPALENALAGKSEGDSAELTVTPEEGFGEHDPERVLKVPRDKFEFEVSPGEVVAAQHPSGEAHNFVVLEMDEDTIVLDGNHPFSGKTLHFSVEVVAIRDATEEELSRAAEENGPAH